MGGRLNLIFPKNWMHQVSPLRLGLPATFSDDMAASSTDLSLSASMAIWRQMTGEQRTRKQETSRLTQNAVLKALRSEDLRGPELRVTDRLSGRSQESASVLPIFHISMQLSLARVKSVC
jgi:hypothetical protein